MRKNGRNEQAHGEDEVGSGILSASCTRGLAEFLHYKLKSELWQDIAICDTHSRLVVHWLAASTDNQMQQA